MQSYVSFRRERGNPRLTVYLPVEAYKPGTIAPGSMEHRPSGIVEISQRFEQRDQITNHPFVRRLCREPVNLRHIWLLLANFQSSISQSFARHLAAIVSRIDDDRVRCILAEQLNDEMGAGNFDCAQMNLFCDMMSQLATWRPASVGEQMQPGLKLDSRLADIYEDADVYEAIGALMAGYAWRDQIGKLLLAEFARQDEVDASWLEWLTRRKHVEEKREGASAWLADLVPATYSDAVWHGAHEAFLAAWTCLDELYGLCYARPSTG